MAIRHLIDDSGTWQGTSYWSAISDGTDGASVPASDVVYLDFSLLRNKNNVRTTD